ncbi:MAG: hypothetical protein R6V50_03500 [Thermoplasmatota archaeon]
MKTKKIGLIILILSIFAALMGNVGADQSIVKEVTIVPENPSAGSEITVTVELEGEDIQAVHVIIQECIGTLGICRFQENITMTQTEAGTYEVNYKLQDDEATYITYFFHINKAGNWIQTNGVDIDLQSIPSNGGDDNGSDDSTPGFGITLTIISIIVIIFLFEKKRSQ